MKPGIKSHKIDDAFKNVPLNAKNKVNIKEFASKFNVSVYVLNQALRFDNYKQKGRVKQRTDTESGVTYIYRETPVKKKKASTKK
jgi:hypothetical protein